MITIVGGELFCALGETDTARIKALRAATPDIATMEILLAGNRVSRPYYRLTGMSNPDHPSLVDTCLERVVRNLLKKLHFQTSELDNTGVFFGSSSLDYSLAWPVEQQLTNENFIEKLQSRRVGGGTCAERLMSNLGITGPCFSYNTACTSSANALMEGASMLEGRLIDHALVVGVEFVSPTSLTGFILMQLLSPDAVRPFDKNRNGIVLGEAVSAVLLSRDDVRPSCWSYLGGESNCETYSVIGTEPDGLGIARVMAAALEHAGIFQETVTAIKAHGTGSELMDTAELRAMEKVFDTMPPYFSLKSCIGHTLGGCGTAELVLLMESVNEGFLPATLNFQSLDAGFSRSPIQEEINVAAGRFMLNYFGFGGNNTSFIIEKRP